MHQLKRGVSEIPSQQKCFFVDTKGTLGAPTNHQCQFGRFCIIIGYESLLQFHGPDNATCWNCTISIGTTPNLSTLKLREFFDHWKLNFRPTSPNKGVEISKIVGAVNLAQAILATWSGAQLDPLGSKRGDPSLGWQLMESQRGWQGGACQPHWC
jgi:hypothetical protein